MLAYIAAQDPSAAALVANRVIRAEKLISSFPRGAKLDGGSGTYDRFIPRTRIVLTYEVTDDMIVIVGAWHTSRDPADKPQLY